jgi:Zn-dependent peptidase ImmA (M78 family)
LRTSDGSYSLGCCDDLVKTIYINNNLSNYHLRKVLCHEIAHAIIFSYNVTLTYEQEELLADIIASYGHEIVQATNLVFNRLRK